MRGLIVVEGQGFRIAWIELKGHTLDGFCKIKRTVLTNDACLWPHIALLIFSLLYNKQWQSTNWFNEVVTTINVFDLRWC
jgi:hypothetical protein